MNFKSIVLELLHVPWQASVYITKLLHVCERLLPPAFHSCFSPSTLLFLKLYRIKIGSSFYFHDLPYVFSHQGKVVIGDRCGFGEFTRFYNFGEIEIGSDFLGAAGLQILTGGHDPDTWEPIIRKVKIGNRVWCGANVTIMPGVTIDDDCVVGTGSLVTKDIPAGSIVAGVPAKVIRMIDMERRHLQWKHARS